MLISEVEIMNIIKFGGSIVNPDGKYDNKVIEEFADLIKGNDEKYLFIVGGGKICRFMQDASQSYLEDALGDSIEQKGLARDEIGIAVTKINARYILNHFKQYLGEEIKVFPEVLTDPTIKVDDSYDVYFMGGWKPGHSTDTDMMLLAKTLGAEKVIKISDFEIVKNVKPTDLYGKNSDEMKEILDNSEDLKSMTWNELTELVGSEWKSGLNTPFDPTGAKIGYELKDKLTLYIGRTNEITKMLKGEEFRGTIVKN
jgi:uridylate kinase